MSGRDLRTFVNFHRDAIGASDPSLVSRLIDGKGSGRYKEVNYEKLKAITQIKNVAGIQSLNKISSIHRFNKEKKEFNILQQHKTCWKKEMIRLNSLYNETNTELKMVESGLPWEQRLMKELFDEVEEYEDFMKEDYLTFSNNTVKPVWDLREDIHVWLEENKIKISTGMIDPSQVSDILESVKNQQENIMMQLEQQQTQLETDLDQTVLQQLIHVDEDFHVKPGTPEEVSLLTCPYEDLRTSILNEFQLLDKRYETHLDYLKVKYELVLEYKEGGWKKDDHLHFQHILDQYPPDTPNRRRLYVDRMIREMPHMSRHMIVKHEEWWFSWKSFQSQEISMHCAWKRDRCDLLLKVKATFVDAWHEYENEKKKEVTRKQQEEICKQLHQKIEAFQQQKLEVFHLQLEISEKLSKQELEKLKTEEEQEKKRREKIHKKVKYYQETKVLETEIKLEEEKKRLTEIRKQMEEQAKKDAERVAFRENELKKRQDAKSLHLNYLLEEQKNKEKRLEKLREQVCVNVTADPNRVLQPTEASTAHAAKIESEELELQKPLFSINTFSTHQITADPRHKVEEALRNAGLHKTDYARDVLASVKPLHPTRPDQKSSLFKGTQ